MIINKTYEVNYVNMDSVIKAMAQDIDNGYTFYKIERLPLEHCTYAMDLKPSLIITMHNKKADLEYGRVDRL